LVIDLLQFEALAHSLSYILISQASWLFALAKQSWGFRQIQGWWRIRVFNEVLYYSDLANLRLAI
jgi:hypothetical protein